MRFVAAALALLFLAVGCAEDDQSAGRRGFRTAIGTMTLPRDPSALPPNVKARFDRLIRHRIARARVVRSQRIAANRRILNGIPVYPRATLVDESQNPQSNEPVTRSVEQEELDLYASVTLGDADYELYRATGWGTFRIYALPRGTPPTDVYRFFRGRLASGWRLVDLETGFGATERRFYLPIFRRGQRCLWFHIGTANGALPQGRSYEVASDVRRASC